MTTKVPARQTTGFPFSEQYISPAQVITSGGLITLNHGLTARPTLVQVELECLTAENGHSIGDFVVIGNAPSWSNVSNNAIIVVTDTQLKVRYGSYSAVFTSAHFTDGSLVYMTNANWQARFLAFA